MESYRVGLHQRSRSGIQNEATWSRPIDRKKCVLGNHCGVRGGTIRCSPIVLTGLSGERVGIVAVRAPREVCEDEGGKARYRGSSADVNDGDSGAISHGSVGRNTDRVLDLWWAFRVKLEDH